jgi:hypothetical protein
MLGVSGSISQVVVKLGKRIFDIITGICDSVQRHTKKLETPQLNW